MKRSHHDDAQLTSARPEDASDSRESVVALLRLYGGRHTLLTRGFAGCMDLHPTDAAVLTEIIHSEDAGSPTTPSEVADRLGLSRPGMTASLNRLEASGHVERRHDPSDRRRTPLHCSRSVHRQTARFFAPIAQRMDALVASTSPADLAAVRRFMTAASEAIRLDT